MALEFQRALQMLKICCKSQRQLPILFLNEVTKEMSKLVQKFHVSPPNACVFKDLSFSAAECIAQLINFTFRFLHKKIINAKRFGCAMQLIVHNYVKNTQIHGAGIWVWVSNSFSIWPPLFSIQCRNCCPRDLEFFFAMVTASIEAQSTWFPFNFLKPHLMFNALYSFIN